MNLDYLYCFSILIHSHSFQFTSVINVYNFCDWLVKQNCFVILPRIRVSVPQELWSTKSESVKFSVAFKVAREQSYLSIETHTQNVFGTDVCQRIH